MLAYKHLTVPDPDFLGQVRKLTDEHRDQRDAKVGHQTDLRLA